MGKGSPLLEQAGGDTLRMGGGRRDGSLLTLQERGQRPLSLASGRSQAQKVCKIEKELKRLGFSVLAGKILTRLGPVMDYPKSGVLHESKCEVLLILAPVVLTFLFVIRVYIQYSFCSWSAEDIRHKAVALDFDNPLWGSFPTLPR